MPIEIAIILTFAGMVCFYGAGDYEARDGGANHAVLWAALSVLISGIVFFVLNGGLLPWLICQAVLFVGIGAVRMWLEDWTKK